jgi:pimeloyl-ACP methyl ester carboxylesterase
MPRKCPAGGPAGRRRASCGRIASLSYIQRKMSSKAPLHPLSPNLSRRALIGLGAGAMVAACTPAARRDSFVAAHPPIGRLIEVEGHYVHVHVAGRGPDIILLHGASANLRDFTFDLAPRLAREFRVIAFDRPGLGYSQSIDPRGESPEEQAALLDAAAAQLGVRRAIVLGHSYAGSVALAWAIHRPRRVAGIVTLSGVTMPWPGNLGPWYPIAASEIGGATLVPLVSTLAPQAAVDRALDFFFAPQQVPPGYGDYVGIDLALRPSAIRANARQIDILKPHVTAMAAYYPRLTIPAEIVHGTADRIVPPRIHAIPLAGTLPNARLSLMPDVGHMPHHVRTDEVIAIIRRAAQRAGLKAPARSPY